MRRLPRSVGRTVGRTVGSRRSQLAFGAFAACVIVAIHISAASDMSSGDIASEAVGYVGTPAWKNPQKFKPGEVWLDTDGKPIQAHGGGMLVHGDTFYWYGENKDGKTYQPDPRFPNRVDVIGVSCYSSKDLHAWKNEGVVLPASPDPQSDLHYDRVVERPKVLYNDRTGKFVMWMHIDNVMYQYARTGIAVADRPEGPFTYLRSISPHGFDSRDMTLFKDDDGTGYLIYSSENNQVTHIGPLTDDFLDVAGPHVRAMVNQSRESPAVFKHNARGGTKEDRAITFESQSTHVLPLPGEGGKFIFMADRWRQYDLQDSRFVWLPLQVSEPHLEDPQLGKAKEEEKLLWASVYFRWLPEWSTEQMYGEGGV